MVFRINLSQLRDRKLSFLLHISLALVGALVLSFAFGQNYDGSRIKLQGGPRKVREAASPQVGSSSSSSGEQVKDPFANRPRIRTKNGHLVIEASQDKNIDFRTSGSRGTVTINGLKLDQLMNVTKALEKSATSMLAAAGGGAGDATDQYEQLVGGLMGSGRRLVALEKVLESYKGKVGELEKQMVKVNRRLGKWLQFMSTIVKEQETMANKLKKNECFDGDTGQPVCKNGATCLDTYGGFKCLCPPQFEGATCEQDVDECAKFRGTDLGCQNGAKCVNLVGGYKCECTNQFHGVHCTEQHDDCALSSSRSLCGQGKCVNLGRTEANQARYECICDQGWTTDGLNPACVVDVNECLVEGNQQVASNKSLTLMGAYPCSQSPFVECTNLPGSFQCGPCPPGYTGNGRLCRDLDECRLGTATCSRSPPVECINTAGGYRCAPCPPGYTGDGFLCSPLGACNREPNDGCHPLAKCVELTGLSSTARLCQCQYPYVGEGLKPSGCKLDPAARLPTTSGSANQSIYKDECQTNPCFNGATCLRTAFGYECICTAEFAGPQCQRPINNNNSSIHLLACDSIYFTSRGTFAQLLKPSLPSCNSTISVAANMSLLVTLKASPPPDLRLFMYLTNNTVVQRNGPPRDCPDTINIYERLYLELSDSGGSQDRLLARLCLLAYTPDRKSKAERVGGKMLAQNEAVTVTSESNTMVVERATLTKQPSNEYWKYSSLLVNWTQIAPLCGGQLPVQTSGSLSSPKFPQFYAPGTECRYLLRVPPGQRVRIQFGELNLLSGPSSDNCSDSLTLLDGALGADRPILFRHCANHVSLMSQASQPPPTVLSSSSQVELLLVSRPDSRQPLMRPHQRDGFYLTYAAELNSAGCGGLFTAKAATIKSADFVESAADQPDGSSGSSEPATTSDPRQPYQLWRLINPEPWTNNLNQKSESSNPLVVEATSRIESVAAAAANRRNKRVRCEYEIRPATELANHKLLIDWVEMPSDSKSDYWGKWSRRVRCMRTNLRVFDANPLAVGGTNRSELANFCSGDKYDASSPEQTPIQSSGRLLYLIYETTQDELMAVSAQGGFRLHYSTVCTAILGQLNGRIEVQVDLEVSECIYHIVLPPNNSISLVIETDRSYMVDGTCAAEVVFLDGAIQGGKQALLNAERELKRFNLSQPLVMDLIESRNREFNNNNGNNTSRVGSQLMAATNPSEDIAYWQYSSSQAHDIKEFQVCKLPQIGLDSIWNHLSLLLRLNSNLPPSSLEAAGVKSVRVTIKYQAEPACGGIISEPSEGSIKLDSAQKINRLNAYPLTQSKFEQLHSMLFTNICAYILRAPNVNDVIQVSFEVPAKEIQQRYSDWLAWYKRQPGTSTTTKQQQGDDPQQAVEIFNCSLVFYETIELYEPAINSTRYLCPLDLVSGSNETQPITWLTQTNTVLIKLTNNSLETAGNQTTWSSRKLLDASRFKANYKFIPLRLRSPCGGKLFMDTGTLRSPRFPYVYPSNMNCVWIIQAANPRQQVRLNFTKFSLEDSTNCRDDYLELRNGPWPDSPLIGRFCGSQLQSRVLVGHSSMMRLTLVTDYHENHPGFEIYFDGAQTGCGGSLQSATGQIDSPNYPQPYAHSSDCEWLIELPQANRIELRIEALDLASSAGSKCPQNGTKANYLAIYDSNGATGISAKPWGKFCHLSELAALNITNNRLLSSGNKMLVVYRSQATDESKGFRLTYRTVCEPVELVGFRGAIESPGYPAGYEPYLRCGWTIRAPLGSNLTLILTDLQVEEQRINIRPMGSTEAMDELLKLKKQLHCGADYVEIMALGADYAALNNKTTTTKPNSRAKRQYLPPSAYRYKHRTNVDMPPVVPPRLRPKGGRVVQTYCGRVEDLEESERRVEISSNMAYVGFETDHALQMRGFRLEWEARGCGGPQVEGSANIEKLTYHEPIARQSGPVECLWTYDLGSPTSSIYFALASDMRLQGDGRATATSDNCQDASFTIYDGPTDKAPILAQNCDSLRANEQLRTSGPQALVRFYSSGRHNFGRWFTLSGWLGQRENCMVSLYDIDTPFNRVVGEMKSPGYPDQYEAVQFNCFAMLSTHSGRLKFRLEELEVPTGSDQSSTGLLPKDTCRSAANFLTIKDLNGREIDESYCGRLSADPREDAARREVVMEQSAAWLEFHTSRASLRGRWRLTYTRLCGSQIQATYSRSFSTPNYPGRPEWPKKDDQPDQSENVCVWRLVPQREASATGDHKLHLSIVNFVESDNNNDCVRIYEGASLNLRQSSFNLTDLDARLQPKIKICRQSDIKYSSLHYVSQGSELVVLTSGRVTVKMRVKPFENYCGGELHLSQAEFATLGYPQSYAPNLDCHYFIEGSPGSRIKLKFIDMDLPEAVVSTASGDSSDSSPDADDQLLDSLSGSNTSLSSSTAATTRCDNQDYIEIRQLSTRDKAQIRLNILSYKKSVAFRWIDQGLLVNKEFVGADEASKANLSAGNWTALGADFSGPSKSAKMLLDITRLNRFFDDPAKGLTRMGYNGHRPVIPLEDFYENSRLIGRYCGKQAPDLSNLQLKDEVLVRFRSHGTASTSQSAKKVAPRGFLAEYKLEYGGTIVMGDELAKLGGFISSPDYPNKALTNQSIRWNFVTTSDSVIKFELISLNLGSFTRPCQDTLTIYSGSDVRDELKMSQVCGHLSFKVLDLADMGFKASSIHKILPVYLAHDPKVRASLVQTVTTVDNTATVVFDNLREPGAFLLRYRAISATSGQPLKEQYFPPNETISFEPPVSATSGLNVSKECSQTFRLTSIGSNSSQITLMSPNWPNQPTTTNFECHWLVYTLENTYIQLSVVPASTEDLANYNRRNDYCLSGPNHEGRNYIVVHDGASRLAPTVARYCLPVPPILVQSTGRQMLIRFVYSKPDPAQARRSLFKGLASVGRCGGQFHIVAGETILDRPRGRGKLYDNNLDCKYYLYASNPDQVLTIQSEMSQFELAQEPTNSNCSVGDYIEIRDLPIQSDQLDLNGRTGRFLGRFCAGRRLEYLESPSGAISIQFKTDASNRGKGFQLYVMVAKPRLTCPRSYQILNGDEPFGRISSPNYPHGFYGRRHCKFHLIAPVQQSLELTFVRLRRPLDENQNCADNLTYLADNEAVLLRFDQRPLRDLRGLVSGYLLPTLLKEVRCRDRLSSVSIMFNEESNEDSKSLYWSGFKTISAEEYFRLRLLAPPTATQIRTNSHVLSLEYETKNLQPKQGFLAIYRLIDNEPPKRCGGDLNSSSLLESGNFNLLSEESDDYIQCDWFLNSEISSWDFISETKTSLAFNLVPSAFVGDFKTAYLVFQILEIPPLRSGGSMFEPWSLDRVNKTIDTCGLNRLLVSDSYYFSAFVTCGNFTGAYKVMMLDFSVRRVSLRTKNLRDKSSNNFYRGMKAYYYEKTCPQAERLVGEGLRFRSHAGYPALNTSYTPGICKWDLKLTGGDYELWFEQINLRPPQNYDNSSGSQEKTCGSEDNQADPELDYLEVRASGEYDAPVLVRYCIHNQLVNKQKALLLNMRSDLSIVFVAGIKRLASGQEAFATNSSSNFGFSMQLVRVRNDSEGEFCRRDIKNNILSLIRSNDKDSNDVFFYLNSPSPSFLYPKNTHCVVDMSLDEGSRFNLTFRGIFDMELSKDCSNDYIQIDDLIPLGPNQDITTDHKTPANLTNVVQVITKPNQYTPKRIGRWCGRSRPNGSYLSQGGKIRITFHSNDHIEGKGFQLDYSIIQPSNMSVNEPMIAPAQISYTKKLLLDLISDS